LRQCGSNDAFGSAVGQLLISEATGTLQRSMIVSCGSKFWSRSRSTGTIRAAGSCSMRASSAMADYKSVADVGEIPEGEGRSFSVNGRMVAVFLTGGEYFAISDTCPHMGASLGSGAVEGQAVSCPWHAWRFSMKDGSWLDAPNSKLRADCFAVRVVDDEIQVLVPDPPPRGSVAPAAPVTPPCASHGDS
jgi:nitrite reductase (NADH) small subunit